MKHKFISTLLSLTLIFSASSNAFAASTTSASAPELAAKTAVAIDASTGEVIYSKQLDEKIYPASTTKLLTAILFTENKKPSDILGYSKSAFDQPTASINKDLHPLKVGEKISAGNVMKGLLMYSANDMAYVIASNLLNNINDTDADTTNKFSAIMNKKVQSLGLKNTHFVTANGLHDPNHYSTAYDMSQIAKVAFSNDWILKTISTQKSTFATEDGLNLPLENRNKLINPKESVYDQTCIGGKTGYTSEAGKCLVAIFNRNGKKIIGVVMNSLYDQKDLQASTDMENLINYSYTLTPTTLYKSGSKYTTVKLSYKPFKLFGPTKTVNVPLMVKENVNYFKNPVNDTEKVLVQNISNINPWKLNTDTSVGTLTLKERGVTKNYKLYSSISSKDLISDNKLLYGASALAVIAALAILITLIYKIVKLFTRKKTYF